MNFLGLLKMRVEDDDQRKLILILHERLKSSSEAFSALTLRLQGNIGQEVFLKTVVKAFVTDQEFNYYITNAIATGTLPVHATNTNKIVYVLDKFCEPSFPRALLADFKQLEKDPKPTPRKGTSPGYASRKGKRK